MALRHSYTLMAPVYDAIVDSATRPARQISLSRINHEAKPDVLIMGIGTGLDIPYLDARARYTGVDITPAMLDKAQARSQKRMDLDLDLQQGDVMDMPFADKSFDVVVMHLILAVVPDSAQALKEAARVLKPGGQMLILDKFIKAGQWAPIRRLVNLLLRHIATKTNVIFEHLLPQCSDLVVVSDQKSLMGGWFRCIELVKSRKDI